MGKIHSVCETSNLRAVHYAERIWDAVADFDVDNGTIGYLEDLAVEGGVIYNFKTGTKEGATPVLVHNPEWTEDTSRMTNQRKDKFFTPADTPFRAYTLHKGDEFALSEAGFTSAPEVGKYVTIDATGKLAVSDTAPVEIVGDDGTVTTPAPVMVGKIMRKRQIGSTLITNVRTYGYQRMMYTVKVESLA